MSSPSKSFQTTSDILVSPISDISFASQLSKSLTFHHENAFKGRLFTFSQPHLLAFETWYHFPSFTPDSSIILISLEGLSGNVYLQSLIDSFPHKSIILPQFKCSNFGYGMSSLDEDADELHLLIDHLSKSKHELMVIGHGKGGNTVIRYAQKYGHLRLLKGILLQGIYSERLYYKKMYPQLHQWIHFAEEKRRNGELEEYMPRTVTNGAPITCKRFLSTTLRNGEDDLFSHDLRDVDYHRIYSCLTIPICICFSGQDERMDSNSIQELSLKLKRFDCFKMFHVIDNADAWISDPLDQKEWMNVIHTFILLHLK